MIKGLCFRSSLSLLVIGIFDTLLPANLIVTMVLVMIYLWFCIV